MAGYMRTLNWCLHNRWKTIGAGALFFALSIAGLMLIPKSFVPDSDFGAPNLAIELPTGVRIEDTAAASAAAYKIVARQPEVTNIVESIGEDDSGEIRTAQLYIQLVPRNQRNVTQKEWEDRVMKELRVLPDAQIHFNKQGGGGGSGRDVNIYITGDDPELTQHTAEKVVDEMRAMPELRDARINGDMQRPEILIKPRFDLAAQLGVTVSSISETIRIATLGDIDQNSAKFSLKDRQIPIRVSLLESTRRDLTTLENLPVPTSTGGAVPLKSVADISFGEGPTKVRRYNQSRRVSIEADLTQGTALGTALDKIHQLPTLQHLPTGVRLVDVGDAEIMAELFTNFIIAITTGILMVFAVLVLLFARVLQPVTILSSLPLSIGGAVLALMATKHSLSLGVMIGFLMLMGIVAKNSILLVDFAIEEMRLGTDRWTALLEAGHKRARPIVMTTVAMVAGMLPVAIGLGGDNAFRGPMAIAVIGGLITSTALTLVIVPAAFTLVDDIERWLGPKFGRVLTTQTIERPASEPHPAG